MSWIYILCKEEPIWIFLVVFHEGISNSYRYCAESEALQWYKNLKQLHRMVYDGTDSSMEFNIEILAW